MNARRQKRCNKIRDKRKKCKRMIYANINLHNENEMEERNVNPFSLHHVLYFSH